MSVCGWISAGVGEEHPEAFRVKGGVFASQGAVRWSAYGRTYLYLAYQWGVSPGLAVGFGRSGGHFNIKVGSEQQVTVTDQRWEPAATAWRQ